MPLPTDIDATYEDNPDDPSVKEHQQQHDALHGMYNEWEAGNLGAGGEYTIAVIPDTQYLTQDYPHHFTALADWIEANRAALGIELVLHVGDVVQIGNTTQFNTADGPMTTLFGLGVPFLACIGNHDYDNDTQDGDVDDTRAATNWNAYFGTDRYTGQAWFDGDFYDPTESENFFVRMTLGGRPTLILVLEFGPRAAVVAWAEQVLADHPFRDCILLTHSHVDANGAHVSPSSTNAPSSYSITDYVDGAVLWDEHLRLYPNVIASFNGHHLGGNVAVKLNHNDFGGVAYQQFNNWQNAAEGGEGRIVLMTVNPTTGIVRRRVYNPATAAYEPLHETSAFWFVRDAAELLGGSEPAAAVTYHFDATQLTGLANGGAVAQLPDLSGNEFHADSVHADQATYQTGVLNGNPVVRFAGNAAYRYENVEETVFPQPRHVFVVVKRNGTGTRQYVFDGQNISGSPRNIFALMGGTNEFVMWAATWLIGPASDTAWHKFELIFDSTSSRMLMDDVEVASGDAGPYSFAPITIGATSISPHTSDFLDGDLAELRILDSIVDGTPRDDILADINAKWGL